jgi:hypothetical protein
MLSRLVSAIDIEALEKSRIWDGAHEAENSAN